MSQDLVKERGLTLEKGELNHEEFEWEEEDPFREDMVKVFREYFEDIAQEKGINVSEAIKADDSTKLILVGITLLALAMYQFYVMGSWLALFFILFG